MRQKKKKNNLLKMKIMRHLTKTEEKDENKNEKMTIIEDNARFDLF